MPFSQKRSDFFPLPNVRLSWLISYLHYDKKYIHTIVDAEYFINVFDICTDVSVLIFYLSVFLLNCINSLRIGPVSMYLLSLHTLSTV